MCIKMELSMGCSWYRTEEASTARCMSRPCVVNISHERLSMDAKPELTFIECSPCGIPRNKDDAPYNMPSKTHDSSTILPWEKSGNHHSKTHAYCCWSLFVFCPRSED